jgi:hypothetical protein
MSVTSTPTVRSRAGLKGRTTTQMLVHSLALSLVTDDAVFTSRHVRGSRAGQDVAMARIRLVDLQAVVAGSLAASTLKGLLRDHPALYVQGSDVLVDL